MADGMTDGSTQPLTDGTPSTWGARLRRRRSRPPRRLMVGSVLLHALAVAAFWLAGIQLTPEPDFVQYRVTLVSPPPQQQGEPEPVQAPETPVIAEPAPDPPPSVEPEKPKPDAPKPEPPKAVPPKQPPPRPEEKKAEPTPAKGPDPKPSTRGGENLEVQQDGEDFPYQDYLDNIVIQLHRMFRWSGSSNLEAEVVFYIQRDGSVGGLKLVRRSGNFQFDLQAHEAVDRAGRSGVFGPLPDGWQQDRLWIRFTFEPPK